MKNPPIVSRCTLPSLLLLVGCSGVQTGFTPRASPGGRQQCVVIIYNGSNYVMDVNYSIATSDGERGARLGNLAPERSRSVQAECGATVVASGKGEGITAQGSAVATPAGDWIVLRS